MRADTIGRQFEDVIMTQNTFGIAAASAVGEPIHRRNRAQLSLEFGDLDL